MIPLLQLGIIYQLYQKFLSNLHNYYSLHPIFAFILSFVIVDYFYYWNHRLCYTSLMWQIHQVNHTVTHMEFNLKPNILQMTARIESSNGLDFFIILTLSG